MNKDRKPSMESWCRIFIALLALLSPAGAFATTSPALFAGNWGGTWTETSSGTSPHSGTWAATVTRTGDLIWCWSGVCFTPTKFPNTGTLRLGSGSYFCSTAFDFTFTLNPPSANGGGSCTYIDTGGCFLFLCPPPSTLRYEIKMTGGRVDLPSHGNYEGLWWRSPAGSQSGWGVHLAHQGDILFATWFTYDRDGKAQWLVMPNLWKDADAVYSGPVFRMTGPAFDAMPWNPSRVKSKAVGWANVRFNDENTGIFTYAVDGGRESQPITRFVYSSPVPTCAAGGAQGSSPNYQGLWWRSPAGSESGWGVNIAHQGDALFATWFTYDANGVGTWLAMPNVARTGQASYAGPIYRMAGPWFANQWRQELVKSNEVGTAIFTFNDGNNGTFSYTVNGIGQTKPITRFVYSTPVTVCN